MIPCDLYYLLSLQRLLITIIIPQICEDKLIFFLSKKYLFEVLLYTLFNIISTASAKFSHTSVGDGCPLVSSPTRYFPVAKEKKIQIV